MPRTDPARSSESATRHLFRHFFDEQELLRNPYVGPAIASGRLTMNDLQSRLADAARAIETQDRGSGNQRRGSRQATALLECTLKRRAAPEVALELGISSRQLFRERQAAWARAVRYLIAPEPPNSGGMFADVQCNHAAGLFSSGDRTAGDALLRLMIEQTVGVERFMLAALVVELHLAENDRTSATDSFATVRASYAALESENGTLCKLTMALLEELLERRSPDRSRRAVNADTVEAIVLEPGVKWWMVRLLTRLLIARCRLAVAAFDRREILRTAEAAIALGQRVPRLHESERFDLGLLVARVDWMERGPTPRSEAALIENYLTASANGSIAEVAHVTSMLASMMIIAGRESGDDYAQMALALADTMPEHKTARFAYLNLVVAELDAGHADAAGTLLALAPLPKRADAPGAASDPTSGEYALLAREIQAITRSTQSLAVPGSKWKASEPIENGDLVRRAYAWRVAALERERQGDRRDAIRLISEAWEIATHHGDWMAQRTIGRTYRHLTRRPPPMIR